MQTAIKRESIVAQLLNVLQRELPRYKRFEWLPSERVLCDQFQVSRTTLRAVLSQLQRRRLITAVPRRGYRVEARVRGAAEPVSRLIVCLQKPSFDTSEVQSQVLIRDVEHLLNLAGYTLKVEAHNRMYGHNRERRLAAMVAACPAACWVLNASSRETQRWFAKEGVPALVMGSCYPGIHLPSLDIDYQAICSHAVNHLWRLNHRHIAFLTPRQRLGGDVQSELGFVEGWRRVAGESGHPIVVHHDGQVEGLCRALDLCLAARPAPTALLISRTLHALTAVGHLTRRGIRLPEDLSLICRDSDDFLGRCIPAVTRYTVDWHAVGRHCARTLQQLATAGRLPPQPRLLMARFTPGETAAPLRTVR